LAIRWSVVADLVPKHREP